MGFSASLQNAYVRKLDIVTRGYSGYNTKWVNQIIDDILDEYNNVEISTLFLGANDACVAGIQHVPLEDYKNNLRTMSLKVMKKSKLVLISPPPLDEIKWPDRKFQITMQYRNAVIDLGKELHVPVLDLYSLFLGDKLLLNDHVLSKCLNDGLHLSKEGNQLVFQGLLKVIVNNWPELNPDSMPAVTPLWRDIVNDDVKGALIK
jgi:lysophospholipase L1-like esterase